MKVSKLSDDEIFQEIYNAIVEQKMVPGMKVTEEALGEVFQVSRTRVRKVLFDLEHFGLVGITSHKTKSVAKPTVAEAKQVFQLRKVVETGVAQFVCNTVNRGQTKLLQKHIESELQAVEKRAIGKVVRLSGEFHLELIKGIRNEFLNVSLKQLVSKTALIVAVFQKERDVECLVGQHQNILDAVLAKDEAKVSRVMESYLNEVEASFHLDHSEREPSLDEIFKNVGVGN